MKEFPQKYCDGLLVSATIVQKKKLLASTDKYWLWHTHTGHKLNELSRIIHEMTGIYNSSEAPLKGVLKFHLSVMIVVIDYRTTSRDYIFANIHI